MFSTHMKFRGRLGRDLLSVHLSVDLGDQTYITNFQDKQSLRPLWLTSNSQSSLLSLPRARVSPPCSASHMLGSVLPAQPSTCWGQSSPHSLPRTRVTPLCSASHVLGSLLSAQPPMCWVQSSPHSLPHAGVSPPCSASHVLGLLACTTIPNITPDS